MLEPTGSPRLFRGAPTHVLFHATFEMGKGWRLVKSVLHEAETVGEADTALYDHLGTQELLDVWYAELEAIWP